MSVLTGCRIRSEVIAGRIIINPFTSAQLNPNSYNLRLANVLTVYDELTIDPRRKYHRTKDIEITESGLTLMPNQLYLGHTQEYTGTKHYVPMIEGRSSIARLGLNVHVSAGFGDIGFHGCWTLEIVPTIPVMLYPDMEICQIFYHLPVGPVETYYNGKYQNARTTETTKIWREFQSQGEEDRREGSDS